MTEVETTEHLSLPFWNIWKIDPKTGRLSSHLGMITDVKTGFEWIRKQGLKQVNYRINNVPPVTRDSQPRYETYEDPHGTQSRGENLPAKAQRRPIRPKGVTTSKPTQRAIALKKSKKPDTPEQKAMKAQAATRLAKHQKDEAKELG